MTNQVDTSTDTINAEFEAAEQAIGISPEINDPTPVVGPMEEAEREAQIAIAKEMIGTTLRLSIGMFANVSVDNQYTDEAAQAYAVVIIKYFPGGIFGLLDKYKEEIAAGTATFMLVNAITQAKAKQKEEEAQQAQVKKPQAGATESFDFNTTQGESHNG